MYLCCAHFAHTDKKAPDAKSRMHSLPQTSPFWTVVNFTETVLQRLSTRRTSHFGQALLGIVDGPNHRSSDE